MKKCLKVWVHGALMAPGYAWLSGDESPDTPVTVFQNGHSRGLTVFVRDLEVMGAHDTTSMDPLFCLLMED